MIEIPRAFLQRMQALMGEEFRAFERSLNGRPCHGLRVNVLKINPEDFNKLWLNSLTPIPWCHSGYYLAQSSETENAPGKHPYHAAGLYYLQEPSAMAAAEIVDPQPGERILDLCASPGGKSTQLAALMKNKGLLVANEIHPQRVWDLASNLERCGVQNTCVTNENPLRLAELFGAFFDRVLVDAPCSGEGMFRKSESARFEWSHDLVFRCATRQLAILREAARMVHPGGRLVYTTCTFAPEENETVVAKFLDEHDNFGMIPVPAYPNLAPGRPEWVIGSITPASIRCTRLTARLWPHLTTCEGHFLAVFERTNDQPASSMLPWQPKIPPQELALFSQFCTENLARPLEKERLSLTGSYLYRLPDYLPRLSGLRVIHPGLWLGTFKKNRFEPSHALGLALKSDDLRRTLALATNGDFINAYLRGESLSFSGENGWLLLTVDGFPLGWGKLVDGVLKNHYPRGLRWV